MKQLLIFLSSLILISSVTIIYSEKVPVYENPVIVKSSQLGNRKATVSLNRQQRVYKLYN